MLKPIETDRVFVNFANLNALEEKELKMTFRNIVFYSTNNCPNIYFY